MGLGFRDLVEDGERVVEAGRESKGGEQEFEKKRIGAVELGL